MEKMTVIITWILAIIIIGGCIVLKPYYDEYKSMKKDLQYFHNKELRKQGSTTAFGDKGFDNPAINYDLRSWDGGKNWYLVDNDWEKNEFKVIGNVDSIYPGLLKHLEAWDKMSERVASKGGPLEISDSTDVKILEEAGFTIIKTK